MSFNPRAGLFGAIASLALALGVRAEPLPTGVEITPTAAPGAVLQTLDPELPGRPDYRAGQASALALSPDGQTLLLLTSGFNRLADAAGKPIPDLSDEYVFVYDVGGGAPKKTLVLKVPNTFQGLAWAPSGDRFYVSGGVDDRIYEYRRADAGYVLSRTFPLGHAQGLGLKAKPMAAGLAVSPDGRRALVANYQNDSVSLLDLASGAVLAELDLRPGVSDPALGPKPGGSFPRTVAFASDSRAYVGVERDRELVSLDVGPGSLRIARRIALKGQPSALLARRDRDRLFVALDNTDGAAVLDTRKDVLLERVATSAPRALLPRQGALGGVGSNALALSPDGRTLLISNGGQNAVAFLALSPFAAGEPGARRPPRRDEDGEERQEASHVVGLAPTGWYPTALAVSAAGDRIFVAHSKSDPGPNPKACRDSLSTSGKGPCQAANEYVWQLEKGGLLSFPTPSPPELGRLTRTVAENNHYTAGGNAARDAEMMAFLRAHVRHVVYIVKENRTYDQILGDLEVGNGDPRLALLGEPLTPNHHALARAYVTFDNFMDSGESSNTGWNWTTAGRTTDFTEREAPVNYADRGLQYDQEGTNRNVNVGYPSGPERLAANPLTPKDPNLLVGEADVAAPDGPSGAEGEGYLWNAALKAGLSVRNYGFYGDLSRYEAAAGPGVQIPLERDPHARGLQVFFPTKSALRPVTDLYFRGFDQAFPDYWRFKEWEREFDAYAAAGDLPRLTLLRLPHDHFGSFSKGIDGVSSVETEIADNDYALGLVVQKLAASRFASDTLVFVVEDDAQDGADHVNAHRSIALLAGPYVRHRVVVSERYTTVDLLRTIEEVLGLQPLNLNDAMARPMTAAFDPSAEVRAFRAVPSRALEATRLPIDKTLFALACPTTRLRTARYWARVMAGQDFSREDDLDTPAFNSALWKGLRPGTPEPRDRSGEDLSGRRRAFPCAAEGEAGASRGD